MSKLAAPTLAVACAMVLTSVTGAQSPDPNAVDINSLGFLAACTGDGEHNVYVVVDPKIDLGEPVERWNGSTQPKGVTATIVNRAAAVWNETCPDEAETYPRIGVYIYKGDPLDFKVKQKGFDLRGRVYRQVHDLYGQPLARVRRYGTIGLPGWNEYSNREMDAKWQAAYKAEQEAKAAAAEARAEQVRAAEREAAAAADQERAQQSVRAAAFFKTNGVQHRVGIQELAANPFVYSGKVVAIQGVFQQMLTPTDALFFVGDFSAFKVSGIPAGRFTRRSAVMLIGRVIGMTEVSIPVFGVRPVPHLKFVASAFCQQRECADYSPRSTGDGPAEASAESVKERLNAELGEAIADTNTTLETKLLKVDLLVRKGADLNGSAGRHPATPMEAVLATKDVQLLKSLLSRGLNLRKSCPAYTASAYALDPGGVLMLEVLLQNGMELACLSEPPLHRFLIAGIAFDTYPTDRAIQVANVLIKHGADVNALDSRGKSILDRLDDPNWAVPVAALKDALVKRGASVVDRAAGTVPLHDEASLAAAVAQCKARTETDRASATGAFYWFSFVGTWKGDKGLTTYASLGTYSSRSDDGSETTGTWRVEGDVLRHTAIKAKSRDGQWRTANDWSVTLVCVDQQMFLAGGSGQIVNRRVR